MRPAVAMAIALLVIVMAAGLIDSLASLVFVYRLSSELPAEASPLYFVTPAQPPAYCGDAVRYANAYNASFSASGLAFTLQNVSASGSTYYLLSWPVLLYNVTRPGVLGLYLPSGTLLWAGDVSPPPHGYLYDYLSLSSPLTSTATYSGQVNFTTSSLYPGVWFTYGWRVTVSPPLKVNVLSLVDGQSYQATLVYQGDYDTTPTSLWPRDLSGPAATTYYWDNWFPNAATQAVMNVTPGTLTPFFYGVPEAGAVFWSYSYKAGENVTLEAVLTYANSSTGYVGHGLVLYLFISPYGWSVKPSYNFSVVYVSSEALSQMPSPVMGDVIFPNSSVNYLVVQFDPAWAYNYFSLTGPSVPGSTGPWNVWVVTETKAGKGKSTYYKIGFAPSPSPNLGSPWSGWDGYGSWPFLWVPDAGDYVLVCVRYDPSNGYLYGYAQDLDWPFYVSYLKVYVGPYFPPPGTGKYAFGVGAGTGYIYAADWGLVFANISS